MNKSFVQKILAVVLGLSLFVMLTSVISLVFDGALADDAINIGDDKLKDVTLFMKWSSIGLACVVVPTLVCYAFAFFGNKKIFNICAAVLSFFVAACSIAFIFVVRKIALKGLDATVYAGAAAYFSEMLELAVPSILVGVFFILNSIRAFKPAKEEIASEEA